MPNSADFLTLTTPTRVQESEFTVDIPEEWQQGRGAFGGLVLANLLQAARACEPEAGRTLRSLTAELVGPVLPGPARIRVELLRRGSGVSTMAARLTQGAELLAHAVIVLGRTRVAQRTWNRLKPPSPPPFDQVAPLEDAPVGAAQFAKFFEYRPTVRPFQSTSEAVPIAAGWLRLRSASAVLTEAELLGLADAWWPCALAIEPIPRPMATLAFTFELLADPARLRPYAPVFHRAEAIAAQDGYTVELRELWSEDGELLALNQQTIAIIK